MDMAATDEIVTSLAKEHGLIQMGTCSGKSIWVVQDLDELRSRARYRIVSKNFFVFRAHGGMSPKRWTRAKESNCQHIIMDPSQWESFREWADRSLSTFNLVGPTVEGSRAWGNNPPEFVHHPKWISGAGYQQAKAFGVRKEECRWSDSLTQNDFELGGRHPPLIRSHFRYIYVRQSDGRFRLSKPNPATLHRNERNKSMDQEKTIQSTTTLLKEGFKKGGKIEAADRVNQILCDNGVKKMLAKMGASEEFLNSEFGDLLIRWMAPTLINEMCVRTNLVPHAQYVSAACGEAFTANSLHTLRPIINKMMPMFTALAEVGKEIVEDAEKKVEAASNVEPESAPAVQ